MSHQMTLFSFFIVASMPTYLIHTTYLYIQMYLIEQMYLNCCIHITLLHLKPNVISFITIYQHIDI